jgi:hypothetical protein
LFEKKIKKIDENKKKISNKVKAGINTSLLFTIQTSQPRKTGPTKAL